MQQYYIIIRNPLDNLEFYQGYKYRNGTNVPTWGSDMCYIFTDRSLADSCASEINGIVTPITPQLGR